MKQFNDTAWLLDQWARWIWINRGVDLGYPRQVAFNRPRNKSRSIPVLVSDEVACEVDWSVAQLCLADEEMGRAVVLYYMRHLDYRRLGKRLNVSSRRAEVLVKTGVSWISDALDAE